jgi:hypothetical protein
VIFPAAMTWPSHKSATARSRAALFTRRVVQLRGGADAGLFRMTLGMSPLP